MNHGLSPETVAKICTVFSKHPEIERALLYGSRAKGTYKPGSDIDLTLLGEDLSQALLSQILDEIDDLFLPYMMDLSIFDTLNHEQLQSHIRRVGLVFYDKTQQTSG
jgi:predicted nucleotidyltransferase